VKHLPRVIFFTILCLFVGFTGSFFTAPQIHGWYAGLNKPLFTPPNWIFAPVWTSLYILMGIAAGLAWKGKGRVFFLAQLFFNFLWSLVFFSFHQILLAFAVIVVLWFLILKTFLEFKKVSQLAASLLVPYLLWVTFASILNLSLFLLN
jgi:tryptophan-rich sensory protein